MESRSLDAYITGHWGEDQFRDGEEDSWQEAVAFPPLTADDDEQAGQETFDARR